MAWTGVDLDGTLAEYHGMSTGSKIGDPIGPMVERVKRWLAEGRDVRIFTARVSTPVAAYREQEERKIEAWCREHLGRALPITCKKDPQMVELWDDRAVEVRTNTGIPVNFARRNQ